MKFKRMLAAATAVLVMACSVVPGCFYPLQMDSLAVHAEDAEILSGSCGENVTWSFDARTGTMTISGTGEMYSYREYPWYYDYEMDKVLIESPDDILSLVVEEGVTYIGDSAFYGNKNLTSVTLPDGICVGIYSF